MNKTTKLSLSWLTTAVEPQHYPQDEVPEVALVGRSNAGKSSFINGLSVSKIAKISKRPGKTKELQFFNVGQSYRLVDLPGFGFAKVSEEERKKWRRMINVYFKNRPNLKGVVFFSDIRRSFDQLDHDLLVYLYELGLGCVVVLTKKDQVKSRDLEREIQARTKELGTSENVFAISAIQKEGVQIVEKAIFQQFIKPDLEKQKGKKP